jgi:hypothetical protein
MLLAKSNRVAAACTACPTKSEPQYALEWTPRVEAILRLTKKWTSFIACTIGHEGFVLRGRRLVIARSVATKQSILSFQQWHGLLRFARNGGEGAASNQRLIEVFPFRI